MSDADPMADLTRITEDAGLYAERRGDLAAIEAVQIARFWRGLERYGEAVRALERMRMEKVADSRDVMALMKAVPDAAAELVKRHRHWIRCALDAEQEAGPKDRCGYAANGELCALENGHDGPHRLASEESGR
jgi:hypothetical protein